LEREGQRRHEPTIPLDPSLVAPEANSDDGLHEICADVAYKRLGIVNVVYVGLRLAGDGKWVLIDPASVQDVAKSSGLLDRGSINEK
jgi:hypothetical protein